MENSIGLLYVINYKKYIYIINIITDDIMYTLLLHRKEVEN